VLSRYLASSGPQICQQKKHTLTLLTIFIADPDLSSLWLGKHWVPG
jgi:hypothetical protein